MIFFHFKFLRKFEGWKAGLRSRSRSRKYLEVFG